MLEITDFKIRKQLLEYSCGIAAVRSIFLYCGLSISEQELREKIGITKDGLSHKQMRKLVRMYNFSFYSKSNSSILDIEKYLSKNIPVIVNYQSGKPNGENGHYAVLVGYDAEYVKIADPSNYYEGDGKKFSNTKLMTRKDFLDRWWDINPNSNEDKKWMAIIKPKKK